MKKSFGGGVNLLHPNWNRVKQVFSLTMLPRPWAKRKDSKQGSLSSALNYPTETTLSYVL